MRVLVVDDSVVFRSQIKAALEGVPQIEVVGVANNGKVALQKLEQMSVDLVTLDMEMPEMDGVTTIREIKKAKFPTKIIVFSAHTTRGSEAALDALSAGAHDFVAKPSGDDVTRENSTQKIREQLLPKILQFVPNPTGSESEKVVPRPSEPKIGVPTVVPTTHRSYTKKELEIFRPNVIVIGSSTGGPPALERVLKGFARPLRVPILITQHMPPVFTASLASRLREQTGVPAAEAVNGEVLKPDRIYVAPGDYHLSVGRAGLNTVLKLDQGPQRNSVRPAVDVLFESVAEVYGSKVLAVVLTGMGADGMVGSVAIKERDGGVIIQDQQSCVVFGMPGAVMSSGAYDCVADLDHINSHLKRMTV